VVSRSRLSIDLAHCRTSDRAWYCDVAGDGGE
jgi:hypothetical protein